ncbi:MAG: hypothetical protein WD231_03360 [Candidatus Woykebacteria bacterium]
MGDGLTNPVQTTLILPEGLELDITSAKGFTPLTEDDLDRMAKGWAEKFLEQLTIRGIEIYSDFDHKGVILEQELAPEDRAFILVMQVQLSRSCDKQSARPRIRKRRFP